MRRLARVGLMAAGLAVAGGCTTVRVVQREGCWVRETKRTLRGTQEDVGPCVRPAPKWSEDRLTRLVQECVAQSDYRWQVRAMAAWSRRDPLPPQDSQETVIKTCMNEAAAGVVTQNETLKERLAEVSNDREAFRSDAAQGNQHLRASADRVAEYLGEAAKRPPPVATATATSTSDGMATTENGIQSETGATTGTFPGGAAAPTPVVAPAPVLPSTTPTSEANAEPAPGAPDARARPEAKSTPAKRSDAAKASRKRVLARAARRAGCEVPAASGQGASGADVIVCPPPHATTPEAGGAR